MTGHRWIRIASYPSNQEAALAQSVLEGSGIPSKVFNQHALGIMPHLNQMIMADLMVAEARVPEALEVLGLQSDAALPVQELGTEAQQKNRFRQARGVVIGGLVALLLLFLAWFEIRG
jgi:hypothetical protein